MIFVRIYRGAADHFFARKSEWALATMLFGCGIILLLPGNTFALSPTYQGLARLANEDTWGWTCLFVGSLRLIALVMNGTFYDKPYGRYSPHIRSLMAFLSAFFWFNISYGIIWAWINTTGGIAPFGMVVFPGLTLLDIINSRDAVRDAGKLDRARRDANP